MPPPGLEKLCTLMHAGGLDLVALIPGATLRWLGGGEHYLGARHIVVFIPRAEPRLAVLPHLAVPLFRAASLAPQRLPRRGRLGAGLLGGAGAAGDGWPGDRRRGPADALLRGRVAAAASAGGQQGRGGRDEPREALRLVKDPAALQARRPAVRISEEALRQTLAVVRRGLSEITMAGILAANIRA